VGRREGSREKREMDVRGGGVVSDAVSDAWNLVSQESDPLYDP
jgi:hypothetical protein